MRYYIGVDCGGSKTAIQIVDQHGRPLGSGIGGPGNVALVPEDTLRQSLRSALATACDAAGIPVSFLFDAACAGIAGYSATPRRVAFEGIFATEIRAVKYITEPDYAIAYWGATHGSPGIIVVAGTGAVTFGRNSAGETHREDGLGYLLGDRGSGFNLGLRTLHHALDQIRSNQSDTLTEAILNHTGARTQNDIIYWLYGNFSTRRVAELAPIVGALADAGDPLAREHVAAMAHHLRYAVRQTRFTLDLPGDTPVYLLGGLWQIGTFLREEFRAPQWHSEEQTILTGDSSILTPFVIAEPQSDAVSGAAWNAQHLIQ